jgi:hypothetical protein
MQLTISVIGYYIFGKELDYSPIQGLRPHIENMTAAMVILTVPLCKNKEFFVFTVLS